ncbi:hypothetical protein ACQEVB_17320 [Pseudonocardia sp. CA-107938]|uniref:hypothetical protein n=1 Tax=Pseudonocardia sp. CA-107938 TaxID=3240021 RepID=UPI003D8ED25B
MTAVVEVEPDVASAVPASGPRFGRLLAAERIKLLSTRSVWWCAAVAVVLHAGLAAVVAASYVPEWGSAWPALSRIGLVAAIPLLVAAALAATGEHRSGTMRTTFLAAPDRVRPLVAKAVAVGVVAGVAGLVGAFAAWGAACLLAPTADLALVGAGPWRTVAGIGLVDAVLAVLAVAVGVLLRHGAGAIAALLGWMLVAESVLQSLPGVGQYIAPWLPISDLGRFLEVGIVEPDPSRSPFTERLMLEPWLGLGYAAGVAVAVLVAAIALARRRDA